MDWIAYMAENAAEVYAEMRGWLMDCGVEDDTLADMDDAEVYDAVHEAYDGGVPQMVYDAFLTGEV